MSFLGSLRRALHAFYLEPMYAFAVAGTVALAVGAAGAGLAVVRPALIDPLPYRDAGRLVTLLTEVDGDQTAVAAHVLQDLAGAAPPLEGFASIRPVGVTLQHADTTETVTGNLTTAAYFHTLGVQPAIGRSFADGERDAVVISWSFWQRAFAGDAAVAGRRLLLDGRDRTVVGVMPQGFLPPYWPQTSVWLPLDMDALLADPARGRRTLTVIARRTSSQTGADAFLRRFSAEMRARHPVVHGHQSWVAVPLREELVGSARPALAGTAAAAGLLLLIACANVAGLSAVRAVGRQRQVAVRAALGATHRRLWFEQLTDSLAIVCAGSIAGACLASGAVAVIAGFQSQFLDRLSPITMDASTSLGCLLAGVVAAGLSAVIPQRVLATGGAADVLRSSRGYTGDRPAALMRSGLVVAQVALALVLIAGAGLVIRTVGHLSRTALGFPHEQLSTFSVNLSSRYDTSERQVQFERDAVEALRRVPGVTMAHASVGVPVIGGMGAALSIFGRPIGSRLAEIAYMSVAPGYLEGIGVPVMAGRALAETDHAAAPHVAVINDTMARMYWPAGDAVGARVQIGTGSPDQPWLTVVGIVADLRQHGPTEPVRPTAFGSTWQYSFPRRNFTIRTSGAPAALAADVRAAIRQIDPGLAVGTMQSFDQLVADRTARHRLVMLALSGLAVVALVLSASGVYAIVALTSQLRRREYAIHIALGAARESVRWMVLKQGLALGGAGAVAGVAMAAAGTRGLQGLLHGVAPLDRLTFGAAVAIVMGLAAVSAWVPALRAGRVDPADTLKAE